jgi:HlyD family secretion protein
MVTAREIRRRAREALYNNWGMAILVMLVAGLILGAASATGIVYLLLGGPIMLGLAYYFIGLTRRYPLKFETLFKGFDDFAGSLVLALLVFLYTFLWGLLLFIPGIVKTYAYSMSFYIKVDNPGAIKENDSATAVIGGIACNSAGKFTCGDSRTIFSKQSGEVSYQPYKVGDKVEKGAAVLQISSDSIDTAIRNAQLGLNEAQLSLSNQKEQLKNYNLTAPISGKVIKKTSKAGDTLKSSDSKTVMAIIADMSKMVFDINVDELDISKITSGQKVSISSDALEEKSFTGTVEYVSVVGTTTNGVTSYPVTVSVDNPDGLIPGMNVDAKIVVESRTNVLRVPVSAVKRGNIVTVKIDDSKQQGVDPSTFAKNNFITNNKQSADANGQQNQSGSQPSASADAQGKTQGNKSGGSQGNSPGGQVG